MKPTIADYIAFGRAVCTVIIGVAIAVMIGAWIGGWRP